MEESAFEPTYPIDRYASRLDVLTKAQGQSQRGNGLNVSSLRSAGCGGSRESAIVARFASVVLRSPEGFQ